MTSGLGVTLACTTGGQNFGLKIDSLFSIYPVPFGFWASLPPENITLKPANKTNQILSDFQTSIDTAVHVTLGAEQLIPKKELHLLRYNCLPTEFWQRNYSSFRSAWITKMHDTLENAVSKWVCNTTHILAYPFNPASRQHLEVWVFQFPFLHNVKDIVDHTEPCIYGHCNWSLALAQQQSSLGLSQSSTSIMWQSQT